MVCNGIIRVESVQCVLVISTTINNECQQEGNRLCSITDSSELSAPHDYHSKQLQELRMGCQPGKPTAVMCRTLSRHRVSEKVCPAAKPPPLPSPPPPPP